jgi:hypothetical protein
MLVSTVFSLLKHTEKYIMNISRAAKHRARYIVAAGHFVWTV